MSKTKFYRHCRLVKGSSTQRSYIPEEYAVVGNTLSLKDDDKWDAGWIVKAAGRKVHAEVAEALEMAFKRIWKPSAVLTDRGRK